jgi:hypothetical protein
MFDYLSAKQWERQRDSSSFVHTRRIADARHFNVHKDWRHFTILQKARPATNIILKSREASTGGSSLKSLCLDHNKC